MASREKSGMFLINFQLNVKRKGGGLPESKLTDFELDFKEKIEREKEAFREETGRFLTRLRFEINRQGEVVSLEKSSRLRIRLQLKINREGGAGHQRGIW